MSNKGASDVPVRSQNVMVNKNVKLRPRMIEWFRAEALRNHTNESHEIRRWLELAFKYRQSITDAENATPRFVREIRRNDP